MNILLGFIVAFIFALILTLVIFVLVAQVELRQKLKAVEAKQFDLKNNLLLAKQGYNMEMQKNNVDVAKEISKIRDNSICYVGLSGKVAVSEMLVKFIKRLGYEVEEEGIKIIKKGVK